MSDSKIEVTHVRGVDKAYLYDVWVGEVAEVTTGWMLYLYLHRDGDVSNYQYTLLLRIPEIPTQGEAVREMVDGLKYYYGIEDE